MEVKRLSVMDTREFVKVVADLLRDYDKDFKDIESIDKYPPLSGMIIELQDGHRIKINIDIV